MKTLLILTDWFAPAYKAGGPIRSCVNLARLLRTDYRICVLTGDRDMGDEQPFPNIAVDSWTEWEEGIQVWYASPEKQSMRSTGKIIRELNPDILYLNSMYSVAFTIFPLLLYRFGRISGKLVLAPRGMLQAGAIRLKSTKKKVFLRGLRLLGIHRMIHWHATDQQEAADIRRYFPHAPAVSIISNVPETDQPPLTFPDKEPGELRMVFISRISPKKNLTFLLAVLQKMEASIHLQIAGPLESESYFSRCRTLMAEMPSNVRIEYLGSIDRPQIRSVLEKNHTFVLPTAGENFGHAIFEALLAGRPVVISPFTPWQDLEENAAGFLRLPDDAAAWQDTLGECADWDAETYRQFAAGAWQYARRFLENSDLRPSYTEMFG